MMLPFPQIQPGKPIGIPQQPGSLLPLPPVTGDGTFESLLSLFGTGESVKPAGLSVAEPIEQQVMPAQVDVTSAIMQAMSDVMPIMSQVSAGTIAAMQNEPASKSAREDKSLALFASIRKLDVDPGGALDIPTARPWMISKLVHQIELPVGNYQVLKTQVQDGTLNLEVAAKDKLAEPIKISVPLDMLKNEQSVGSSGPTRPDVALPTSPRRVVVQSGPAQPMELDALLDSVNLRELQVSKAPASSFAAVADEPIALRLIGEQAGQKVVLAAKLEKSDLKATTAKRAPVGVMLPNTKMPSGPAQVAVAEPNFDNHGTFIRRIRPARMVSDVAGKPEDFESIEQLLSIPADQSSQADKFESLLGNSKTTSSNAGSSKLDMPAVKISLPLEPLPVKPDAKTIMLRIEPEHLGPARLHLTMRHESLSAKVTVETSQAKAAVEASLNQLTDQLNRAGVKVDYIQVDVRNGGADNQHFQRPAEWFRANRPPAAQYVDDNLLEIAARAIPLVRPAYVGASGVNLYA